MIGWKIGGENGDKLNKLKRWWLVVCRSVRCFMDEYNEIMKYFNKRIEWNVSYIVHKINAFIFKIQKNFVCLFVSVVLLWSLISIIIITMWMVIIEICMVNMKDN